VLGLRKRTVLSSEDDGSAQQNIHDDKDDSRDGTSLLYVFQSQDMVSDHMLPYGHIIPLSMIPFFFYICRGTLAQQYKRQQAAFGLTETSVLLQTLCQLYWL
jgi:hypothetical protein